MYGAAHEKQVLGEGRLTRVRVRDNRKSPALGRGFRGRLRSCSYSFQRAYFQIFSPAGVVRWFRRNEKPLGGAVF